MDYITITGHLLALLDERGIEVRKEPMGGGQGGLCSIKNKRIFFLDQDSAPLEMAASCAKAIGKTIEDIEGIYLKPVIREFIDKYGTEG
ncbi:MAG: hypothetical protein H8E17_12560 [Deltaproteobacteria bacterium]|nr:hypothetical protein [Deltaproteobacteria bacterium]